MAEQGSEGMPDRFARFTVRARRVLTLAHEEALRFQHNYIGTEHLLLGLVRESEGVAAKALANLGVELFQVRGQVETIIGRGQQQATGQIGLTPRAKKVIELAVDEARQLNHHYIGTEHLLLGLMREGEGIATGVLESLGVALEPLRVEVLRVLGTSLPEAMATPAKNNVVTCRLTDGDVGALDDLVEAGVRSTRADAASWLIRAGIEANAPLLETVRGTVAEIRRLREHARSLAREVAEGSAGEQAAPKTPDEPPSEPPGESPA
jgi:ATP-dependent Clp protease ATP-binding subunit ClpA